MSLSPSDLDELRRLARECADATQKAGEAARAMGRILDASCASRFGIDEALDPEICQALGEMGKPILEVSDLFGLHTRNFVLFSITGPRPAARRAREAYQEGVEISRSRCSCDTCTADRARARDAAEAAVARSRVAAGGPAR